MTISIRAAMTQVIALVGLAVATGCGSPYYTADPIEAHVVDAETGQPIEGAVVTANWQLLASGLEHPRRLRQLEVMEATTDATGRFRFPGFTRINVSLDQLGEEDPQILIFKPGYEYFRAINHYDRKSPGPRRTSSVNGKTLKLTKASGDVKQRAFNIDLLTTYFATFDISSRVRDRIPRMIGALVCEKATLKAIDPSAQISIPGSTPVEKSCE